MHRRQIAQLVDFTHEFDGTLETSGRGSAWLERLVRDQEVGGSNPLAPTTSRSAVVQASDSATAPQMNTTVVDVFRDFPGIFRLQDP